LTLPKCLWNFGLSSCDSFGDINSVPNFHKGCCAPCTLPSEKMFIDKKCGWTCLNVWNFNFLCLKVPEILRAWCFQPVRCTHKRGRGTFDIDSASRSLLVCQFPFLPLRGLDTLWLPPCCHLPACYHSAKIKLRPCPYSAYCYNISVQ